jgi:hypothetical protein
MPLQRAAEPAAKAQRRRRHDEIDLRDLVAERRKGGKHLEATRNQHCQRERDGPVAQANNGRMTIASMVHHRPPCQL